MRRFLIAAVALVLLAGVVAPARADTSENIVIVYTYLTETLGYNRAAACGILSNIQYESNFRPNAIGDSGAAYGICQWNSRRQSLINYCERNGFESWQDIYGQLGYLDYELENNKKKVGDYLKQVPDTPKGAYDAGYYFCVYFEIPANRYEKGIKRGSTAVTKYFAMYGGSYETYDVTFDLQGGAGSFSARKKIEGVPLVLSEAQPEREGFTFLGWSLTGAGGKADLQPGDAYEADAPAALHALWRAGTDQGLEYAEVEGGLAVCGCSAGDARVRVPAEHDGKAVCAILEGAFGKAQAVSLPESVTRIDPGAFEAGTLLVAPPGSFAYRYALQNGFAWVPAFPEETLKLDEGVRLIEADAFRGTAFVCADLFDSRVERIESGAFADCGSLSCVLLPDSLSFIAPDAFPQKVTIMAREGSYGYSFAAAQGYRIVPIN
ncbi:MAG: InlB B-repeat-containing protein [Clostridia bacterium]|nr:InlB B-repeat-containing protein [Clostridia bacterium]